MHLKAIWMQTGPVDRKEHGQPQRAGDAPDHVDIPHQTLAGWAIQ